MSTTTSRSCLANSAVYVDISGDGAVRTHVHAHYGGRLAHSAAVGVTHWTQMAHGPGELDGPSPVFFFAPDRIKKRGVDWGAAKLDQNVAEAWAPFAQWASDWLRVDRISSEDDIQRAYLELLDGKVDPTAGTVVDLSALTKQLRPRGNPGRLPLPRVSIRVWFFAVVRHTTFAACSKLLPR